MDEVNLTTEVASVFGESIALLGTVIVGIVAKNIREYISEKKNIMKYNDVNDKIERVLDNSISWAKSKNRTGTAGEIARGAKDYMRTVTPDLYEENDDKMDMMLERKLEQLYSNESLHRVK